MWHSDIRYFPILLSLKICKGSLPIWGIFPYFPWRKCKQQEPKLTRKKVTVSRILLWIYFLYCPHCPQSFFMPYHNYFSRAFYLHYSLSPSVIMCFKSLTVTSILILKLNMSFKGKWKSLRTACWIRFFSVWVNLTYSRVLVLKPENMKGILLSRNMYDGFQFLNHRTLFCTNIRRRNSLLQSCKE